jgi:putative transposase
MPNERRSARLGSRLGRKALGEVANAALPDTILAWYRRLVARKFSRSPGRQGPGRPRIDKDVEDLIVRMAKENRSWGYDRIVGALANLGYEVSDQTVGNVLRRHDMPPAPQRKHTTTWAEFIRMHLAVLAATDFFTVEVLTIRGLVTYYVLFFIHLESRKVHVAGVTFHPNEQWMQQIARNATMDGSGFLGNCRYLLHDRDTKYSAAFRAIIESGRVKTLPLPPRSPNLNAHAERWVRSVKDECLSKIILLGERSLRRICRALPYRAKSPGEGQRPLVPVRHRSPSRQFVAMSQAARWALALLLSKRGVNRSATRIDDRKLASGPTPTQTMIAFSGDDEPSANSYSASAAAALSSAINRFFRKGPEWRVKRRTNVEGTADSV